MKNWLESYPPYEGNKPYLYFAFAEEDSAKAWRIMRAMLTRGCRVWYCFGAAGSSQELLRRQERSNGAAMTVLYITDAACSDADTKSNVLVNQKFGRPILCLDPDGMDRRLTMGLRETVPHAALQQMKSDEDIQSAVVHAEGFSQEMLGEPVVINEDDKDRIKKLTIAFTVLTILLLATAFVGVRFFHWFRPTDEVVFQDPVILSAVREAVRGGAITEKMAGEITVLRLDGMPESWDELSLLPALERIELPQQALADGGALPEGDYVIELSGGGA